MTLTNEKSIRYSTAGWITIARDRGCSTLLNGEGLTTPLTPQVGNHPNTSLMHQMWSRSFTRLIQISWPPKFMGGGTVLYVFLHGFTLNICFVEIFLESQNSIYNPDPPSSTILSISLMAPSTSDSQVDTSLIAPCC